MFWRFGAVSSPAEQWNTITSSLVRPLSNHKHSHVHVTQKCKIFRGILYVIKSTSIPSYMKNFCGRTLGSDNWYLKIPVFVWHRQWKNTSRCYDCLYLSRFLPQNRIEPNYPKQNRTKLLFKQLLKGRLVPSFRGPFRWSNLC